jgi:hypothetical protein
VTATTDRRGGHTKTPRTPYKMWDCIVHTTPPDKRNIVQTPRLNVNRLDALYTVDRVAERAPVRICGRVVPAVVVVRPSGDGNGERWLWNWCHPPPVVAQVPVVNTPELVHLPAPGFVRKLGLAQCTGCCSGIGISTAVRYWWAWELNINTCKARL